MEDTLMEGTEFLAEDSELLWTLFWEYERTNQQRSSNITKLTFGGLFLKGKK